MKSLIFTLAVLTSTSSLAGEKTNFLEHAVLTQFYRWYTYYENYSDSSAYESQLKNQLEILSDDIELTSLNRTIRGLDEYADFARKTNRKWQNSHKVISTNIRSIGDNKISLEADILYRNIGILPEGRVLAKNLHYSTVLRFEAQGTLPRFERIEITDQGDASVQIYEDLYIENRLRSLVHYWLATLESPQEIRTPEPLRELLAPSIEINFGNLEIRDFAQLSNWFQSQAMAPITSKHELKEFTYEHNGETSTLNMVFNWNADLGDKVSAAVSKHSWIVKDNPKGRYPLIEKLEARFQPEKTKMLSTIYAWYAFHDGNATPTAFQLLMAEGFTMSVTGRKEKIEGFEMFKAWLLNSRTLMDSVHHHVLGVEFTGKNIARVIVEWTVSKNGKTLPTQKSDITMKFDSNFKIECYRVTPIQ